MQMKMSNNSVTKADLAFLQLQNIFAFIAHFTRCRICNYILTPFAVKMSQNRSLINILATDSAIRHHCVDSCQWKFHGSLAPGSKNVSIALPTIVYVTFNGQQRCESLACVTMFCSSSSSCPLRTLFSLSIFAFTLIETKSTTSRKLT